MSSFKSLYVLGKAVNMIINVYMKHPFVGIQVSNACINIAATEARNIAASCRLFARPFLQILYFLEIPLPWIWL